MSFRRPDNNVSRLSSNLHTQNCFARHVRHFAMHWKSHAAILVVVEVRQRMQWRRDVSERALRVLRKEAEKYIEVRSRLATLEGLQAASFFQQGLTQHPPSMQSPPPAGTGLIASCASAAFYQLCVRHLCALLV